MIYSVWLCERAAAGSLEYEEASRSVCLYAVFVFVCLFYVEAAHSCQDSQRTALLPVF